MQSVGKMNIYTAKAIWEKNGKYFKQEFVLCAKSSESAEKSVRKKFVTITNKPDITVDAKADTTSSPIERTYYASPIMPVNEKFNENMTLRNAVTDLTILWGQEIGWRRKSGDLSDTDKLCLDKLLDEGNTETLIKKWAEEYCSQDEANIKDFFAQKLCEYIGANVSSVYDVSEITDGEYARIMKNAKAEAQRIIDEATAEAEEKKKQIDAQITAMIDAVKNLEALTKNGTLVVKETVTEAEMEKETQSPAEEKPSEEDYLPEDDGMDIEPENPDAEYYGEEVEPKLSPEELAEKEKATEQTTENIETAANETPSETDETPVTDKTLSEGEMNNDDEPPEITEKRITQEMLIAAISRFNPKIIIDELQNMTAVLYDKRANITKKINGLESYKMYCKQYGQRVEPYRMEILINVLKSCEPVDKKSAVRYLYDKYLVNDNDDLLD